ncbi:hypothetical protein [Consotaella aegiceratis]|uniref:hypothetical protein n=1 Tax=Consotaella aegiceratis TaxID=3097961 RepID=UPI002F40221C
MPSDVAEIVSQIGLEAAEWHPGGKRADLEGRLSGTEGRAPGSRSTFATVAP